MTFRRILAPGARLQIVKQRRLLQTGAPPCFKAGEFDLVVGGRVWSGLRLKLSYFVRGLLRLLPQSAHLEGYGDSRQDENALFISHAIAENAFKGFPGIARQTDREKMLGAGTRGPTCALAIPSIEPIHRARPKNSSPRTVAESLSFQDCPRAPMQEGKGSPRQSFKRGGRD